MNLEHLTGNTLKQMIRESYQRIKQKAEYLNDINVFPVPDGDTGQNMEITMSKVVEELDKRGDNLNIKEASKAIAKGAFVGAKGNSGVILSQFFVGFAKTIENEEHITTELFADALIEGSKRAYSAVMNPKEGTILTVVKETAEAAKIKTQEGADWKEVVEYAYEKAQKATVETPNLLDDLKEAGVIDAGALGFVYLLQGWLVVITSTYEGPRFVNLQNQLDNVHSNVDVEKSVNELKNQYCTEVIVNTRSKSDEDFKNKFHESGDSLLVIQEDNSIKLHIHANNPKSVIKQLLEEGEVVRVKIDDMKAQTIKSH